MDEQTSTSPSLGYFSQRQELPPITPAWMQSEERLKREDQTSTADYVGAMLRQDTLTGAAVAWHAGQQIAPDANYSPFEEKEWKSLTEGIWPEFQNEFSKAHSGAHALYIKDLLLEKQKDLTILGDMGVGGNIGRLALGAINPENILMGYAGGAFTKGMRAYQIAKASRGAATEVAASAAKLGAIEATASAASKADAVITGVVAGGVGNAAVEKLRQSMAFENDDEGVVMAGLIGAAFTGPFALAGAKQEARIAEAAAKERATLEILQKAAQGEKLTPAEGRLVEQINQIHESVRQAEGGDVSAYDTWKKLNGIYGPELPDNVWLDRYGEGLKTKAEQILDEMYPSRVTERTKQRFLGDQPPLLGYDPTVKDGEINAMVTGKNGQAYPAGMTPGDVEASLKTLSEKRFKKQADRDSWVRAQMDALFGFREPVDPGVAPKPPELLRLGYDPEAGKPVMQVGKGGVAHPAMSKADVEELLRDMAAKKFPKDPEKADRWAMEQRASMLGYKAEVATKVKQAKESKKAARAKAKANPDVVIAGNKPEAPVEAPKDPAQVIAGEKPVEAPSAPQETPSAAPQGVAPTETQKVPVDPRLQEGLPYEWRNRNGDDFYGVLESIRDDGVLMMRDEYGKLHPVYPNRITTLSEPPSGFLSGSVGAAQVAEVKKTVQDPTAFRKARFDYFSILDRSESELVRDLSSLLIKDPIQSSKTDAQGMTASEWKSHVRRTIGGIFQVEAREAAREAAQKMGIRFWQRGEFYHEFHSMVSRLTRGDLSVTMVNKEIAPMLERAAKAQREVYARLLEEAKKVGVKGAEDIEPNDFYVNRVWNHKGIREAIEKHGADAVHKLLATSINVPGYIGDVKKAAQFLNTVQKLEFSKALQNVNLYAQDMGTLRGLLAKANLQQDEIDLIVDMMFAAKERSGADTGNPPQFKYRFDINETLSTNTNAGVLRISDLLENDARVLVDSYLNTMGGHIALAKKGIFSEADFQARVSELTQDAIDKGLKGVPKDVEYLNDIYSNIVGRPMSTQDFSGTARVSAAMRGYTRSVMLGQLGIAAAFEMKQAVGLMGFRAFYQQMPAFRGFIDAIRNGYIPDNQLARDVMHMQGWGTEMSMGYARAQEIDEGFLGQSLTRIEDIANKASHAVDIMSGNASFTSLTRQFASMMAIQRNFDLATGKVELTPKLRERMVGWGVDDDMIESVLESMKKYTQAGPSGKVETINWEKWLQEEPGYYDKYQTLLSRMVRDSIQDQDLGEMAPFMHQTVGKILGELKTFFMVAHAKNMLKNAYYFDATAFQVFAVSFIGEMLAYSTQVSLNYAHDPDKRDELLQPEAIALAAFSRSPVNGMVPFFVNTGYQVATGGQSLVGPDMTANTGNRTFVPPSLIVAQRLYNAPFNAVGMLTGQTTQSEAKDTFQSLPGTNMLGMRNLASILSNSFPKQESRD